MPAFRRQRKPRALAPASALAPWIELNFAKLTVILMALNMESQMRFRYLLLFVCAAHFTAAVPFRSLAYDLQEPDPDEQKAITALRALGAEVFLHKDDPRQAARSLNCKKVKNFAQARLHFRKLTKLQLLNFANSKVGGDDLAALEGLDELLDIDLTGTKVGDEDLARLPKLKNLRNLYFHATTVEGVGWDFMQNYPKLRGLWLSGTKLTDKALAFLAKVPQLEHLDLAETMITDEGLKHVQPLLKLTHLSLGGTKVTDDGMKYLTALKQLEGLNLNKTDLTDKGLVHIARLENLTQLQICNTKVTAAGLPTLKWLTKLDILYVPKEAATPEAVALLRKALPKIRSIEGMDLNPPKIGPGK
jgi:hypothetical protein